jgi:hypothetical protein
LRQIAIAASLTKPMKFSRSLSYSVADAAELLELVEEALDDVALLVDSGVVGTLERAVSLGRNDKLANAFSDLVAQVIGV